PQDIPKARSTTSSRGTSTRQAEMHVPCSRRLLRERVRQPPSPSPVRSPAGPFLSVFPTKPPPDNAPVGSVVGGFGWLSSASKVSYHPSQVLPNDQPMNRAGYPSLESAPNNAPAPGVSGDGFDRPGGACPTRSSSEVVRIGPVGPVLPVVALVVLLRADLQVFGVDAATVMAPVADDAVAWIFLGPTS
ncbi:hypothetical protein SAMN05444398_11759, partial [Roseovarius pacificus]